MRLTPAVLFIALITSACGSAQPHGAPGNVNVAAVRDEIAHTIGKDRAVVSMGKVSADHAIVYTAPRPGQPVSSEETWIHDANGWKLEHATALGNAAPQTGG